MNCPTCAATLHCLGAIEGRTHYHCPRCGTHRIHCGWYSENDPIMHDTIPSLVLRCRQFAATIAREEPFGTPETAWHRFGIAESIDRPA